MRPKISKMASIGFLIIAVSMFVEIAIMVGMTRLPIDKAFSAIKYYLVWVAVPYFVMSVFLLWHLRSTSKTLVMDSTAIFLVSSAGLLFLIIDHSGWTVLIMPLLQVPIFIGVRFLLYLTLEEI